MGMDLQESSISAPKNAHSMACTHSTVERQERADVCVLGIGERQQNTVARLLPVDLPDVHLTR